MRALLPARDRHTASTPITRQQGDFLSDIKQRAGWQRKPREMKRDVCGSRCRDSPSTHPPADAERVLSALGHRQPTPLPTGPEESRPPPAGPSNSDERSAPQAEHSPCPRSHGTPPVTNNHVRGQNTNLNPSKGPGTKAACPPTRGASTRH